MDGWMDEGSCGVSSAAAAAMAMAAAMAADVLVYCGKFVDAS